MIRKRRSLRRQQPGLIVLHIGNILRGHVFCTKQSYLHLWLVPLLASSKCHFRCSFHLNKKYYHQFHVSNCFHVHGLILIPDVSWDFMFFFHVFPLVSFRMFLSPVIDPWRFRPPMAWCSSWPRRASRRHKWSWANWAGPRPANQTGNRFGNDLCFEVLLNIDSSFIFLLS